MNKNPITFLKKHRQTPLSNEEQAKVWQHVASDIGFSPTPATTTIPLAAPWLRPAFAFAMGLVLVLSSSYTVKAANAAAPGDLLYPLDLTLEKVVVVVTPAHKREQLYYKYAQERIDEFEAQSSPNEDPTQTRAREQYVVDYLNEVEENLSPEDGKRVQQRFAATTVKNAPVQMRAEAQEEPEPQTEEVAPAPQPKVQERARVNTVEYAPTPETETTAPAVTETPKTNTEASAVRKGQEDKAVEETPQTEQPEAEQDSESDTQKRSSDTSDGGTSGGGSGSASSGSVSSGGSSSGSGSGGSGSGGSGSGSGGKR